MLYEFFEEIKLKTEFETHILHILLYSKCFFIHRGN